MELVLRGLQWIYLDDVIIAGRTLQEHLNNLREVLQRFRDFGLKLKPKKFSLFQDQVLFLGHIVSKDGMRTNIIDPRCRAVANSTQFEGTASISWTY
jgi:hypothetical protein